MSGARRFSTLFDLHDAASVRARFRRAAVRLIRREGAVAASTLARTLAALQEIFAE
jgi:hypothetical protein